MLISLGLVLKLAFRKQPYPDSSFRHSLAPLCGQDDQWNQGKRNRVAEGYLLHFAIDEMVREEDGLSPPSLGPRSLLLAVAGFAWYRLL